MVTLAQVAGAAGVSAMTASNALRGKPSVAPATRDRVLEAAERLGYRVNVMAKGLRSGRTGVIALAIPELDMPFPAHFAAEVADAAAKRGLRVVVQQTRSDADIEKAIIRDLPSSIADGVIMCALGADIHEIEREFRTDRIVLFDERITETTLDLVCSPNQAGAEAACAHLIERGCRTIGIVGTSRMSDVPTVSSLSADNRWIGAHAYLDRVGGGIREVPIACEWNPTSARRAVSDAIDDGVEFDGLFALTDSVALGAIRGLTDRGVRCPEDVKLIGFDGINEGQFSVPTLSSIDLKVSDLAESAVQMLIERIEAPDGPRPARRVVADFQLVERESTAVSV